MKRNKIKEFIIFILILLSLPSCKKEDTSEPIILPAGSEVMYSNSDFLEISSEFYTVELLKYETSVKDFTNISDISPKKSLGLSQNISYIIPKDKNTTGIFLIRVNMSRESVALEAFVIPSQIITPNLSSTLTVELIKKYSSRSVESYRLETISEIQKFIQKHIEQKLDAYPAVLSFSFADRYKFIRNSLVSNYDFLELLNSYDINFIHDSNGIVTQAPFPFGRKNNFPQLDLANSTPTNKIVSAIEKNEVLIRGKAIDLDNDQILYTWKKENKIEPYKVKTEFRWTPDYSAFRAENYTIQLSVTDGGPEQNLTWKVKVADLNRRPNVTSNCPKSGKEGVLITCQISAVDHDGEKMKFTFKDTDVNARALINGQKTNDITRTLTVQNVDQVDFKFTPSNKDAFLRFAFFQFEVEDESGGVTIYSLPIGLEDINTAPTMLGGIHEITSSTDHEWDHCANENPDGGSTPYNFYIDIQDPDNLTGTVEGGFDVVSTPTLTGSLACVGEGCIETMTCPGSLTSTPLNQYFCYTWRPTHNKKAGTLFFTFKDDHGGISDIRRIDLVASDRNQKPCLSKIAVPSGITLNLDLTTYDYRINASDRDLDTPNISVTSLSGSELYPFLYDNSTSQVPTFRRKLNGSTLGQAYYRTNIANSEVPGGAQVYIRAIYQSPYSGAVKLYRPTIFNSGSISIPAGTLFETNSGLMPYQKLKYKTVVAATMFADDLELWIPVEIYDQTLAIGKLNSFKPQTLTGVSVSQIGITVNNPTVLNTDTGTVTITRASTLGALTLPKYLEFFSSDEIVPTTSTIRYYNYSPVYFLDGEASKTVSISTLKTQIKQSQSVANSASRISTYIPFLDEIVSYAPMTPQNEMVIVSAFADPTLKVSFDNLYNYKNYSLNPMNGSTTKTFLATAEDTFTLPANEILTDQNGDEYRALTDIKLFGQVQLERLGSSANPITTSLTLTKATTIFKSKNGSRFKMNEDVNYLPNGTISTAQIERTNHTNPTSYADGIISVNFSDKNFRPVFIVPSAALTIDVLEGQNINDYLLEVNDNPSNPGAPNDPFDRHSYSFQMQSTAPAGQVSFCRERGDNLGNINSPACTPCNTPIANDYYDSARCYVRFFPKSTLDDASSDIDKSYTYLTTVSDNSPLSFGESNSTQKILTLKVTEHNDAPVLNDSLWNPITTTHLTPFACGGLSCGDFVEGNNFQFLIYASDPDRNLSNKTLTFSLGTQIFDLQSNSWVAAPASLSIATNSIVSTNVMGGNWGSRYTARINWTPTDAEAKALAGAGFIMQVNVRDNAVAPSTPLTTSGFYKVTVQNINNPPNLKSAVNLTMTSDVYNKYPTSIVLTDADYVGVGAPVSFTTSLSLCKSTSVFNCPAPLDGWPDAIKTFDPLYARNTGAGACRSGPNLNTNLALPLLTRGNAYVNASTKKIEYPYQIEWCPQRSHIGLQNVYLQINDNGDKDRNNIARTRQDVAAPMILKVVAPVFFTSPLKDINNEVINAPTSAFINRTYDYLTLVNNSRGNTLRFQILTAPTGLVFSNGSTLLDVSAATIGAAIKWTPTLAQLTTDNINSWHTVVIRVTDRTTNEFDTVLFKMQVKDPTSPVQTAPIINSKTPNLPSVIVDETINNIFSVTATNVANPDDQLFYSWYVDNVKKYDEGSTFIYNPTLNDAGKHSVKVEVYDGYYITSYTWAVEVRNTIPNIITPLSAVFDLASFNQTKLGKTISFQNWKTETNVETSSGADTFNSILFAGSYTKDAMHRDFIYNLKFKNGAIFPALTANVNPVIAEPLPWEASLDTDRISFKTTVGQVNFTIVATPYVDRTTAFTSSLIRGVCLPNSLGISSFNASYLCNSMNASQLYKNDLNYGSLLSAYLNISGGTYDISTSKSYDELQWTGSGASNVFFNSTTLGTGVRISGIAASTSTSKIYVAVRDVANSFNKLLVFDATSIASSQNPILIATLDINDGVNPDNKASEIIIVNDTVGGVAINKVYILLPGTGGFAILNDDMAIPATGDIQFIANSGAIGMSPVDSTASGRKMVYNSGSKLIYGISKGANQIFTLDVATNVIKVQPVTVPGGLDTLFSFNNDKSVYVLNRTLGQIFQLK